MLQPLGWRWSSKWWHEPHSNTPAVKTRGPSVESVTSSHGVDVCFFHSLRQPQPAQAASGQTWTSFLPLTVVSHSDCQSPRMGDHNLRLCDRARP